MEWLVGLFSNPGDLIIDPFCGSGTTCVAAKMLGRNYIGIDISPDYCEIARQRLEAIDTGVPVAEAKAGQLPLFAPESTVAENPTQLPIEVSSQTCVEAGPIPEPPVAGRNLIREAIEKTKPCKFKTALEGLTK